MTERNNKMKKMSVLEGSASKCRKKDEEKLEQRKSNYGKPRSTESVKNEKEKKKERKDTKNTI